VNSRYDVDYRYKLAVGFLQEAEEDFGLKRWRACVDNAQLSVENFGKTVLMLLGVSSKTHAPGKHLARFIQDEQIPQAIRDKIKDLLPNIIMLGDEEHFLTDYGDESSYRLPWDLFDEDSAISALEAARSCKPLTEKIIEEVRKWRSSTV
jgi:HEPN domain-containing protein